MKISHFRCLLPVTCYCTQSYSHSVSQWSLVNVTACKVLIRTIRQFCFCMYINYDTSELTGWQCVILMKQKPLTTVSHIDDVLFFFINNYILLTCVFERSRRENHLLNGGKYRRKRERDSNYIYEQYRY